MCGPERDKIIINKKHTIMETSTIIAIYAAGMVVTFLLRIPVGTALVYKLIYEQPAYQTFLNSEDRIAETVAKYVWKSLYLVALSWIAVIVQIAFLIRFAVWYRKHKG